MTVDGWQDMASALIPICLEEGLRGSSEVVRMMTAVMRSIMGGGAPTTAMVLEFVRGLGVDLNPPRPLGQRPPTGRPTPPPTESGPRSIDPSVVHMVPTECGRYARVVDGRPTGEVRDSYDGQAYVVDPSTVAIRELGPRAVKSRFWRTGRVKGERRPTPRS